MSEPERFRYYHYDPSLAGNVIFVVLFAIPAIGHTFLLIRGKTWYFIPFVIGCLFEAGGYVGRAVGATETPNWTLNPYLVQALLILLAPALYAASIYMVLGRLIRLLEASHLSIVRINWLTKIFVIGDVLSFMVQGAGGGILSNAKTKDNQDLGKNVILTGLAIQIIFFGLFMATTVVFHLRIKKNPTARSFSVTAPWLHFIYVLYFCSALILIRSVFRMVEYGMGQDSTLMQNEVYLFVLDGVLMFFVSVVFLWYHPGKILIGYKNVSVDGEDVENRGDNFPMVQPGFETTKTYDSSEGTHREPTPRQHGRTYDGRAY